jgi:SAM-dependent MidA family methyltransferase
MRQLIEQEILQHGPIPFSRYMAICLYDPEHGYYSRDAEQFGKAGDFYTSSDVHAVYGRLLARQFEEMWRCLGSPTRIQLIELGPGRGLFARDVMDWSQKKFPGFFEALHYRLIESSPALRKRLETTLAAHLGWGRAAVAEQVQAPAGPAIVFANEFFDALPVEVVSERGELRLEAREGRLYESWAPAGVAALEFVDHYGVHPEAGERVEVALAAQDYARRLASQLERGFLIVVDYGYTRTEQLAGRHLNTLQSFRQHSASPNPYAAPGEQDITAHVNFTALRGALEAGGMLVQELVTQSQFLMGIGQHNQFADVFEDCSLPQERAKVALQLKHLVTPAGMGESFHVLVASKGVDAEEAAKLNGLSFGRDPL